MIQRDLYTYECIVGIPKIVINAANLYNGTDQTSSQT